MMKATYHHPYQMHGSMGSSCAVADVQGEQATIWSATQGVWYIRSTAAMVLGLKPENVRVIFKRGSGCYGINGADTVTYDAALLSQAVGKPVRVQLTRRDEMAWENYGNAFVIEERAGLDAQGNIIALGSRSLGYRASAIGLVPERLEMSSPACWWDFNRRRLLQGRLRLRPRRTITTATECPPMWPAALAANAGAREPSRASACSCTASDRHFWTGPLRSPQRLQNTFAHESFMDELAARAKADPVAYRLRHLSNSRLSDVVKGAAKTANWEPRPVSQIGDP